MRRVLIPALSALPAAGPAGAVIERLAGETMGTTWSVKLVRPAGLPPAVLRTGIEAVLDGIVTEMSGWLPSSTLCRFNAGEPGSRHALPADFLAVLDAALAVAAASDGAFDPTIAPLVDLWGFGPGGPRRIAPPDPAAIAAARTASGWHRLTLDRAARMVVQPGSLKLDLSSIAKGRAVDRIAGLLADHGIAHALVEIGGELKGIGVKPDGTPWWVAFEQPPHAASLPQTVVALHGLAIATSGDYRRVFESAGRRYSHTIDPRSGWPVAHKLASVTVLHGTCMLADAYSTALTVLGPAAGMSFAATRGIAAHFICRDDDGRFAELSSPALQAMLD